jgi:zinc protease
MALAEAVESLGTTLGSNASRDDSRVALTVLPKDFEAALRLLGEVVMEPAFAARDFDRVKNEWLDGIRAERQEPQRLAALVAVRALNGPVLGAPVNGALSDVKRLTVADLKDFHSRAYTPDNAALVVVGDLEPAAVLAEVTRVFGAFRGKNAVPAPAAKTPPPPPRTRVLYVDRPDAVQTAISVVQPFPKRSEPGHEAREILVTALGGLFTSRLNTNLREEHAYTYGAFARAQEARYLGTLVIGTSVRSKVTVESVVEIKKELEALRGKEPPTTEELTRSRADLAFSLGATLEHPSKVAGTIGDLFSESLSLDYFTRYPATIQSTDAQAVSAAANLLVPDGLLVVLVGDQKQFVPELSKAGFQPEAAPSALSD